MITEELTNAFRRMSKRLRSRQENEDTIDALQDAFCRLWVKRKSIEPNGKVEGLLAVTTRNLRIDAMRRNLRFERIEDAPLSDKPEESADEYIQDLYFEINRIIEKCLSPRDKEIFILRDRDGWEFEDLALKFGISENNVRMIVSRARKTIRTFYLNNK